jgi:competence protein ComEA
MGTRQEMGLVTLIVLLALPIVRTAGDGADTAHQVPVCEQPVWRIGPGPDTGLVCLDPSDPNPHGLALGLPGGCPVPDSLTAGDRLRIEQPGRQGCRTWVEPMSGAESLLVGLGIDPNRATAVDLQVLPGIGPALSERIVRERRDHGPFSDPEDLTRVRGIGPKTVARLRPFLRLER